MLPIIATGYFRVAFGSKNTMEQEKIKMIPTYLPESIHGNFKAYCKKQRITMTKWIEAKITEALSKTGGEK